MVYLRYVPYGDVLEFEAKGWKVYGPLGGNHSEYAILMIWEGDSEPS